MSEVPSVNTTENAKEMRPRPPHGGWGEVLERAQHEGPVAPSLLKMAKDLVAGPVGEILHLRQSLDNHPEITDADIVNASYELSDDPDTAKAASTIQHWCYNCTSFAGHLKAGRWNKAREWLDELRTRVAGTRGGPDQFGGYILIPAANKATERRREAAETLRAAQTREMVAVAERDAAEKSATELGHVRARARVGERAAKRDLDIADDDVERWKQARHEAEDGAAQPPYHYDAKVEQAILEAETKLMAAKAHHRHMRALHYVAIDAHVKAKNAAGDAATKADYAVKELLSANQSVRDATADLAIALSDPFLPGA